MTTFSVTAFKSMGRYAAPFVLLCAGAFADESPVVRKARELVTTMDMDRAAVAGIKIGFEDAGKGKPVNAQLAGCVQALDRSDVTDVFAVEMSDKLTAAELDEALKFYKSAAGRKSTDVNFDQLLRNVGRAPAAPAPTLSARE